ncbi:hypothetical protein [Helicobacter cinaedi]|uniref:hypothetical protein n=1 Tax=Helicobacter cinaedi TaxID=213 RepID=UPI001E2D29BE|nr:hypothetical protein [Helicobacter cinaedi]
MPNIDVNEPSIEQTPSDPIAVYEDCIRNFFYEERQELGDMEEWIEQNGEFDKSKAEWKQSERKMLESLSLDKYWEYLLALKAIDDNKIGDWVGKAIEAGFLESVVHQYFIAQGEMLEVSDYTEQEQDKFILRPRLIYKYVDYWGRQPHILWPYGIFSKQYYPISLIGKEITEHGDTDSSNTYWYPREWEIDNAIQGVYRKYNYQPISYKDITQNVLYTYMLQLCYNAKTF